MKSMLTIAVLMASLQVWAHVVPGVTDVRVIQHNGKKVELITNIKGLTLYTFDPDSTSQSNCYDACAKAWPPVILTDEEARGAEDDFSVSKRKDGKLQLNFDGHPLYLYVGDKKAGEMKGDGLGGVWHIAIDEE